MDVIVQGGDTMIYLDYAATTPVRSEVVAAVQEMLLQEFGNPSSIHQLGKRAKQRLESARRRIAVALGVKSEHVFFTGGATEANNWAIRSQAYQARALGLGNHLVCTAIEHPAVSETCQALEQEGFTVSYVQPTVEAFQAASHEGTIGWIAMSVNNEVGSQLPIHDLGAFAKERGIWFHVDAVQSVGRIALDFPFTSLASSGHKLYAPKGVGLLIYQPWHDKMTLQPLLHGGGQERKKRSGTENTPYIIGLATAIELAIAGRDAFREQCEQLSARLYQQLEKAGIAYERNGTHQVPYIHSLWLKGQLASQTLIHMDLAGIYLSAGSACSAGSIVDSRILQVYYPNEPARWRESVRLSFGLDTTEQDIDRFVEQLKQLTERKQQLWHSHNKQN